MTWKELPVQAANVKVTLQSSTSTLDTVETLRAILFPETSISLQSRRNQAVSAKSKQKKPNVPNVREKTSTQNKRQGGVKLEVLDTTVEGLNLHDKWALATETVNATLQALADAVKNPSSQTDNGRKVYPKIHDSSKPHQNKKRISQPTQSIPVHQIHGEENELCQPHYSSLKIPLKHNQGLHCQAKCAQVAFAYLRSVDTRNGFKIRHLQIENGMSAFIGRLITLGFEDLALQELQILKQLLENPKILSSGLGVCAADFKSSRSPSLASLDEPMLADLLQVKGNPSCDARLSLIINLQLQILKLVGFKLRPTIVKVIVRYIEDCEPHSLINLIERQSQCASPTSQNKVANQLGLLAQVLLSWCSKPKDLSVQSDEKPQKALSPEIMFRIQLLVLQIRLRRWKISPLQNDGSSETIRAFAHYLGSFRRHSTLETIKKLEIASKAFLDLLQWIETFSHPELESLSDNEQLILQIRQSLADMAASCYLFDDAANWLINTISQPKIGSISCISRCALLCQVASLRTRAFLNGAGSGRLIHSLVEASRNLNSDLRGQCADINDLLGKFVTLCRLAFSVLRDRQKLSEKYACAELHEIMDQFLKLIIGGPEFLIWCLDKMIARATGESLPSQQQAQKELVVKGASVLFDSLAVMAMLSTASDPYEWNQLDQGLQNCVKLTLVLGNLESGQASKLMGTTKEINFVSLSNAYWCRYLYFRQKGGTSGEILTSLQKSIDILRDRPLKEKIDGSMPSKLEKYGCQYETSKDYTKAASNYMEALQLYVDCGLVDKMAINATTTNISGILSANDKHSLLGRLLDAYFRVATKMENSDLQKNPYFDNEQLSPTGRALLLEMQLITAALLIKSQGPSKAPHRAIKALAESLLSLYGPDYPIRSLRVRLKLLEIHLVDPAIVGNDMLSRILQSNMEPENTNHLEHDAGLHNFMDHLFESHSIYKSILEANPTLQVLERAIDSWFTTLEVGSVYDFLRNQVNDISGWVVQLEFVAEYLGIRGLEILSLKVLHLISVIQVARKVEPSNIVSTLSALSLQYVRNGYPNQAETALRKVTTYLKATKLSAEATIWWHIACAEFALRGGDFEKAEGQIANARTIYMKACNKREADHRAIREHDEQLQLLSEASYTYSLIAILKGDFREALLYARKHVKLNYRAWMLLENRQKASTLSRNANMSENECEAMTEQFSKVSIVQETSSLQSATLVISQSPAFWGLVPRLFYSLTHLSKLFRQGGWFSEARYYVEQGRKIINNLEVTALKSRYFAILGDYLTRKGDLDEGLEHLRQADSISINLPHDYHVVLLQLYMANNLTLRGERESKMAALDLAEKNLSELLKPLFDKGLGSKSPSIESLEETMTTPKISRSVSVRQSQRNPRKAISKKPEQPSAFDFETTRMGNDMSDNAGSSLLIRLNGEILRQRANIATQENNLNLASDLLSEAASMSKLPQDQILQDLSYGDLYLSIALEGIMSDPIYCVLPESTISEPSIFEEPSRQNVLGSASDQKAGTQISLGKNAPRKGSHKNARKGCNSSLTTYLELLRSAQERLVNAHNLSLSFSSTGTIYTITNLLTKTLSFSSAVTLPKANGSTPVFTLFIMELGRIVAFMREVFVVQTEQQLSIRQQPLRWPQEDVRDQNPPETCIIPDFPSFQKTYIDIIPVSWTVITISLSESHDEIRMARIQSGHTPFILVLPLKRHSSREPDEECFGFADGRKELREITNLANFSAHDIQDINRKGAKSEWWKARIALDARLKDLLLKMERFWLGGFRGIFSQNAQSPELLSRFYKSFQRILDQHLPSRKAQVRGGKGNRVIFDMRILELFVNLGRPEQDDFDELLMDLLYFVIDVLQFHGERNAYDEIDFDSMIVKIIDALRQYHAAAKKDVFDCENRHTILILDKQLHCFPWESLPYVEGHAISRLPSLLCLRDRIIHQQQTQHASEQMSLPQNHGLHVSRNNGSSILNPGNDLSATQIKFAEPLRKLSNWRNIIQREPSEDEMRSCLENSDIFLYFGHGSGAQYIRSRTVKKLQNCAITLLMGCSSGVLTEAGEFESYGTPQNYMHAKCPALVANLWDVTDKDIDGFSYEVLTDWGLFQEPEVGKLNSPMKRAGRKGRNTAVRGEEVQTKRPVSLDQAVAHGRAVCKLRYLNGAAPVVYGTPVFLS